MDAEQAEKPVTAEDLVRAGPEASRAQRRERVREEAMDNRLLSRLPRETLERLAAGMRTVMYLRGTSVDLQEEELTHVIFPLSCVFSLVRDMRDGCSPEVGMIGCEGAVGVDLIMGGAAYLHRAVVHTSGLAIHVPVGLLRDELRHGHALQMQLLRFTQAFIAQIGQTAICKRLHSVEQDLCRWLLLLHDRAGVDHLRATHESIAALLGVRREGVTVAVGHLQADTLVSSSRGLITILDRKRLEQHACECYALVRLAYERLQSPG